MTRRRTVISLILLCACAAEAANLADYLYVLEYPVSPENAQRCLCDGVYSGRVHLNGMAAVDQLPEGRPIITGVFSQRTDHFNDLAPDEYQAVFQGGWSLPHDPLSFEFDATVQSIRGSCLPEHQWSAMLDTLALTTLIRFDGPLYHAAQYAETQISGGDTLWQVPWTTLPLPGPAEPQLIWVEGVARIKGIVAGQVTLLASDSLFIMGDLITADTDTTHIWNPPQFGASPAGSPHRIGLIGERDVILAATLENGFANGALMPEPRCGLVNHPVIHGGGQDRMDVVINASILALGCCFEAEFWKTTAWNATPQPSAPQNERCPGMSNTHVTIWDVQPGGQHPDCPGVSADEDQRGTVWLNGSLTAMRSGYLERTTPGPWGAVTIGYQACRHQHDSNLPEAPPPFWPDVVWEDPTPLEITLNSGPASACGEVTDPAAFAQEWAEGQVWLNLAAPEDIHQDGFNNERVLVMVRINGLVEDSQWIDVEPNTTRQYFPELDLNPWLVEDVNLFIEIHRGAVIEPYDGFDPLHAWNANGEECSWSWNAVAVETPPTPAAFTLSDPWPNPFNPVTQVELTLPQTSDITLEVHDLLGRREALLHDGPLPAGAHSFTIDGSDWAAGLHLLTLSHAGGMETRKLLLLK